MASSIFSDCSSSAASRLLPSAAPSSRRRPLPQFHPAPAPVPPRPLFSAAALPLLPRTRVMASVPAAASASSTDSGDRCEVGGEANNGGNRC